MFVQAHAVSHASELLCAQAAHSTMLCLQDLTFHQVCLQVMYVQWLELRIQSTVHPFSCFVMQAWTNYFLQVSVFLNTNTLGVLNTTSSGQKLTLAAHSNWYQTFQCSCQDRLGL